MDSLTFRSAWQWMAVEMFMWRIHRTIASKSSRATVHFLPGGVAAARAMDSLKVRKVWRWMATDIFMWRIQGTIAFKFLALFHPQCPCLAVKPFSSVAMLHLLSRLPVLRP